MKVSLNKVEPLMAKRNGKRRGFLMGHIEPSKWLAFDDIKSNASMIGEIFNGFFKPPAKNLENEINHSDNFEDEMKKLNMDEKDVVRQIRNHRFMFFLFTTINLISILFILSTIFSTAELLGFISTLLISGSVFILSACYAFREHFLYTKLKSRRVILSLEDWKKITFKKQ